MSLLVPNSFPLEYVSPSPKVLQLEQICLESCKLGSSMRHRQVDKCKNPNPLASGIKRFWGIPSLSVILTLRYMLSSCGSIDPVIVICVLLFEVANKTGSLTDCPVGIFELSCGVIEMTGSAFPSAAARNGSASSSWADGLFAAVSKHFPTKRWASASWIR